MRKREFVKKRSKTESGTVVEPELHEWRARALYTTRRRVTRGRRRRHFPRLTTFRIMPGEGTELDLFDKEAPENSRSATECYGSMIARLGLGERPR